MTATIFHSRGCKLFSILCKAHFLLRHIVIFVLQYSVNAIQFTVTKLLLPLNFYGTNLSGKNKYMIAHMRNIFVKLLHLPSLYEYFAPTNHLLQCIMLDTLN